MKRKRWMRLPIMLGLLSLLSGCISPYSDRQPGTAEDVYWICEAPEMRFSYVAGEGYVGELLLHEETIPVAMLFAYGTRVAVCRFDPETKTASPEDVLFMGDCSFGRDAYSDFTMTVVEDQPHPFGENVPTFQFVCQKDKEDTGTIHISVLATL